MSFLWFILGVGLIDHISAHMFRAGHGSVRAGFGPFGHPTHAHRVWEFQTRDNKENVKTRRVFGRFGSGFFGRVSWVSRAGRVFLTNP